ncbi:MAG: hypothetical protein U0169_10275 [Polyangiaceae bacterium]
MPTVPPSECKHITLASGAVASVQTCRHCSGFSLHLGSTTIRLEPAAAESLRKTLGEAMHAWHSMRSEDVGGAMRLPTFATSGRDRGIA